MPALVIRPFQPPDAERVWRILEPVIRAGETYALPREMSRDEALHYWTVQPAACFVAGTGEDVTGTFYIRTNQPGGGAHVCNAGFMVAADAGGRGIGRAMGERALVEARRLGYTAMQFNFVLASNTRAIRLWQYLGFATVGRLPGVFRHPSLGFVDALVMHRDLTTR